MQDSNQTPQAPAATPAPAAPAASTTTAPAGKSNKKMLIIIIALILLCSVIGCIIAALTVLPGLLLVAPFGGTVTPTPSYVTPTTTGSSPTTTVEPSSGAGDITYPAKTVGIDITLLDLVNGMVIQYEVQADNGDTLYQSSELEYDNDSYAVVDSQGNAHIDANVPSFTYKSTDLPLKIVLYELTPDSEGDVTQTQLSVQAL